MLLKIYSPSLAWIGVCDDYTALTITRRFGDAPSIEIRTRFSQTVKNLLREGNLVMAEGVDETFVIESLSYDDRGADSALGLVCVYGRGVLSLLSRRCVQNRYNYHGPMGPLMAELVNHAASVLPGPVVCNVNALQRTVLLEQDYDDSLQALVKLCRIGGAGMHMRFLPQSQSFVFEALDRQDYTAEQTERAPFVFSKERENVLREQYVLDSKNWRNVAYVYGSENNKTGGRYYAVVGDTSSADRRELYLNCPLSVRRYESEDANGKIVVDTTAYLAALARYGLEELSRYGKKVSFSVTARTAGEDFPPLGAVCSLVSKDWDLHAQAVLEQEEWIVSDGVVQKNITLVSSGT